MTLTRPLADMFIEEIIDLYPTTVKVFVKYCLHCVGCPISQHHRLEDCARENELDLEQLLAELELALAA